MAELVHEIWITGGGLPACVLAGPMGDAARSLMAQDGTASLARRFVAGSHFEAMTIYNKLLRREPYTTDLPTQDRAPYPHEWQEVQEAAGIRPADVAPELE